MRYALIVLLVAPLWAQETGDAKVSSSQTSGGGSMRLSLVSVDTPLCDGPRNDGQPWVTASFGSGFGFRCTRA